MTSATRLRSNLRLRSNVYVTPGDGEATVAVQVRGAPALRKYLKAACPGLTLEAAARANLRPWQQAELAYELGCELCKALPEGRVRKSEGFAVEFRCPPGTCISSESIPKLINIEVTILERMQARYGDLSIPVQKALFSFAEIVGEGLPLAEPYIQRPVRLTRTQFYLYKFEPLPALSQIVHACLLALEKTHHA